MTIQERAEIIRILMQYQVRAEELLRAFRHTAAYFEEHGISRFEEETGSVVGNLSNLSHAFDSMKRKAAELEIAQPGPNVQP